MLELDYASKPPRSRVKIRIGRGVLDALVQGLVADHGGRRIALIADDDVAALHGIPFCERLRVRGLAAQRFGFPAGEASKVREVKALIEDRLFEAGFGRQSLILAMGGGVTCDLGGFVASTWHRGVPLIQVPTSLLAMVDASVGGKTGVNLPGGKNLVGTIHQPLSIEADVGVLSTLPEPFYRDGFAEVVKSAVIADASFFRWLEEHVPALLRRDATALEQAIGRCVRIKSRIVARDPWDRGRRAVLNFGHTVAHAVESSSAYRVRHGEAVALGLCVEARLAREATGFPRAHVERLSRLLERFGLPTRLPHEFADAHLLQAAARDKKARHGQLHFALPRRLGRMLAGHDVVVALDEQALRRAFDESRG